jgi:putative photosynthetic complex assembly protein
LTVGAHVEHESMPRAPLLGAAALVAVSILAVAVGRFSGSTGADVVEATPVKVRTLNFNDLPAGGVEIYDADALRVVGELAPGSGSFVRGVLRSLVRQRGFHQVGKAIPFQLTQWSDGHLTLSDPATGERIELRAFGATNERAFRDILLMDGA